ncbi:MULTISPECIES: cytochrome bd-I oxidase subunit CydX [unclassified Erwinia]
MWYFCWFLGVLLACSCGIIAGLSYSSEIES